MTLLFFIWLAQDFTQLLLMGICIVPDVFLLTALFLALLPGVSGERQTKLVWAAFVGGLLWDLRWTNVPGLSGAIGGGIIGTACFLWYKTPVQGRTAGIFTVLAVLAHLIYSVIHFFFWTMPSGSAMRQLAVQQLTAVPVVAVFSWLYWKAYSDNG